MRREPHGIAIRLFLWFWITALCALIALPLFAVASSRVPLFPLLQMVDGDLATNQARLAIREFRAKGPIALSELNESLHAARLRGCIVEQDGLPLQGSECDDLEINLGNRALSVQRTVRRPFAPRYLVAKPLDVDGERYAFVASPDLPPYRHLLQALGRLLLVLLIVSGFCYAASAVLARPFERLRRASRRIAEGDLTARVGEMPGRVREVAELGADFDRMADTVQNLVENQKQLVRDTSHELRSPLARMRVASELARQDGPAREAALDRIDLEIERMDLLLSQMLELARLESDQLTVQIEAVDLAGLLESSLEDARFEAAKEGKSVTFSGEGRAMAAPDLLCRAFENVLRNAIRYTPASTSVDVTLANKPEGVVIQVRDHGPGVLQGELDRIFQAFHRAETDRDRKTGGHGLGLAIAMKAVKVAGGTISASNASPGLRVEIMLRTAP